MNVEVISKPAFSVIGKEGSTADGEGFVQQLWAEANAHFDEVAHLAKRDENGMPVGFWGAMTDCSRAFRPWEDGFSRGLYLAGVECADDAVAPEGWVKWTIPGFEYLRRNAAPLPCSGICWHTWLSGIWSSRARYRTLQTQKPDGATCISPSVSYNSWSDISLFSHQYHSEWSEITQLSQKYYSGWCFPKSALFLSKHTWSNSFVISIIFVP